MDEQWKIVDGTDYAVSNLGRMASMKRNKWRTLNPSKDSGGYVVVGMWHDAKSKRPLVHRLVAAAFLPDAPSPAHEVNHKDGDKANNRADNLEWVTPSENIRHSFAVLGRVGANTNPCKGEKHGRAKLTADKVRDIRARRLLGARVSDMAREFGTTATAISYAILRKTWQEVV
jgi:hypothetical protein